MEETEQLSPSYQNENNTSNEQFNQHSPIRKALTMPAMPNQPNSGVSQPQKIQNFTNSKTLVSASSLKEEFRSTALANIKGESNDFENYAIEAKLGEGAYAAVFLATYVPNGNQYAIKTYEKDKLLDPIRKKAVAREVKILQKLDHPSILKMYTTISEPLHLHLILEYLPGQPLATMLKRIYSHRLDELTAKRIFTQITQAVSHCHKNSITHRDIKCENILVDENKTAKLVDFGFSTFLPPGKMVKVFWGTPSYMAPEIVLKQEHQGPPADVWALGIILYTMVAGQHPFRARSEKELFGKIASLQYVIPEHFSQPMASLIQQMLVLDPACRITWDEILEDNWLQETNQRPVNEQSHNHRAGTYGVKTMEFCDALQPNITALYKRISQKPTQGLRIPVSQYAPSGPATQASY